MYAENDGDVLCNDCGRARAAEGAQVVEVFDTDEIPSNWTCGECCAPLGGTGEADDSFGLEEDAIDRIRTAVEPFCACGRVISECDGSRAGCGKGRRPRRDPSKYPKYDSADIGSDDDSNMGMGS